MHHFNIDKAAYKLLKKERTNIDRAMLLVGTIGPFASIPQLLTIYKDKQVIGISVLSWVFYLICNSLALTYGIVHKLRPLVIANSLWVIIDTSTIVGCLMYR